MSSSPAGSDGPPLASALDSLTTRTTEPMGKGDKRTRRGKINRASYGKNRKRKAKKKKSASTASS